MWESVQASQKGSIGITLVSHWFVPLTNSKADQNAASRSLDFMFGWCVVFKWKIMEGDEVVVL